ncbi:MAG: restriction endonuclease subunit S [Candidatus Poribacteria bacterium]|nr:restriction endonuclease subunit S [Candidatus Poribacteria bacterium]MDE0502531.1 restriction endonuclease subunit S [Candidatus Poribacteria bacterium]
MSVAKKHVQIPHLHRFSGEWEAKQLKELGQFSKGRGIKRDDVSDEGLPCVRYGELYTRYQDYILKVASRIPKSVAATALPIRTGDLLFAGSGETAEEIGRCAAYLGEEQAYAGGDVIVLTPSGHNSVFLGHLMNHPIVAEQKARLGQGDAVVHIYISNLAQIQIDLPPITEQNAIAGVLSDMDGLIGALDALIAKKRAIKQATMQQLLTGKTRLPGFSEGWCEKPLADLATITMGQSPPSIFYNQRGDGIPLIQGNADIKDHRTIDRVWTTQGSKCCDLGDLLLTVRAPVGVVAVASKKACLGRGVCGLKPFGDCRFLFYALNHVQVRWQILEQGSTFTAANSEQIGQFRLWLPDSVNEQRAIGNVFSDMDAEIVALEHRRNKTRSIKQGMMQQLLTGHIRLVRSDAVS